MSVHVSGTTERFAVTPVQENIVKLLKDWVMAGGNFFYERLAKVMATSHRI